MLSLQSGAQPGGATPASGRNDGGRLRFPAARQSGLKFSCVGASVPETGPDRRDVTGRGVANRRALIEAYRG
ncbi:hypothetical protein MRA01_05100 [Methylobacterium radiotolerans]|nr:hypothetical protein MRA01_05100 [Methylobacterium radiotolerans]